MMFSYNFKRLALKIDDVWLNYFLFLFIYLYIFIFNGNTDAESADEGFGKWVDIMPVMSMRRPCDSVIPCAIQANEYISP